MSSKMDSDSKTKSSKSWRLGKRTESSKEDSSKGSGSSMRIGTVLVTASVTFLLCFLGLLRCSSVNALKLSEHGNSWSYSTNPSLSLSQNDLSSPCKSASSSCGVETEELTPSKSFWIPQQQDAGSGILFKASAKAPLVWATTQRHLVLAQALAQATTMTNQGSTEEGVS